MFAAQFSEAGLTTIGSNLQTRPAAVGSCTSTGPEAVSRIPPVAHTVLVVCDYLQTRPAAVGSCTSTGPEAGSRIPPVAHTVLVCM